jgi:Rieske Fe-S protein
MHRRDFLKTSCGVCFSAGSGLLAAALSSCASAPLYRTERIGDVAAVPFSVFSESNVAIVHVSDLAYEIAVVRDERGSYTALLLKCTHAASPLVSTGTGYQCSLHGSKFDSEGSVVRGPAERPLEVLPVSVIGTEVVIALP